MDDLGSHLSARGTHWQDASDAFAMQAGLLTGVTPNLVLPSRDVAVASIPINAASCVGLDWKACQSLLIDF